MPDITIAAFYAAKLVDEKCLVSINIFKVDTSTHESLIESVDAIRKSNHTPEQVAGMLAVVKANAADMFSEEERASLFTDIPDAGTEPFAISIEADGNYPLIYEALDQLAADAPAPVEETETVAKADFDAAVTEKESKITELTQASDADKARISELEAEIEKLRSDLAEATRPADEDTAEKLSELETKVSELTETNATLSSQLETLRSELADFAALKHDSLVKEAARLALEQSKAVAKGKDFDTICETLAARSEDSLSDMIADMKLEREEALAEGSAEAQTPAVESVPQVTDPTVPVLVDETTELDPKDPEGTAKQLYEGITEDTQSTEIYMMCGLSEAELKEIFGNTTPDS